MRSAWCRKSAPSAPPRAGSTPPSRSPQLKPVVHALKHAGIRVSLFIGAAPAQIEAAVELGAPVVELHTGSWCDALLEDRAAEANAEWELLRAGALLAQSLGPRSPCRPRPRLCERGDHRRAAADRRAQYRPFPDWRGGVRGPGRHASSSCARPWTAGRRKCAALDYRARLGLCRRAAHRGGDRAPWRPLSRPHLHRRRAGQGRAARQPGRDLCQAFRRQGGLRQGARHRFPQRRVLARHGRGQSGRPAGRP